MGYWRKGAEEKQGWLNLSWDEDTIDGFTELDGNEIWFFLFQYF